MPLEIVNQNEYLLVKLEGECTGEEDPSVDGAVNKLLSETQLKLVLYQASRCSTMTPLFLRQLTQTYTQLKSINGKLRLVGCTEVVLDQIKKAGLDRLLVNKMSLRGALVDFGLATTKEFDVNFINPFLNATLKTFKVQAFMETAPGKPYMKNAGDPLLMGDISGIISISSETFKGTLAISLTEKIFLKVVKNMLGVEEQKISEGNVDLIGELANIILGQAKIELNGLGYKIEMALPSCVWGNDHKIKHFGGGPCIVIPFTTPDGTFYTEVMTSQINLGQAGKAA